MTRNSKIEPIHREESARLKRLFKERSPLSQEAFGEEYGIGTQGMVWQYLNARSPLNLSAAIKFASGLAVSVAEFSPRLAQELEQLPADNSSSLLAQKIAALEREGKLTASVVQAITAIVAMAGGPQSPDSRETHTIPAKPHQSRGRKRSA